MIVVLGSVHGSPGVTSWSLLLAAAWPVESGTERVVLEADAAGGVLGARYGWGVEPGLASLAAALRRNENNVDVGEHGREVVPGLFVVPAPETAERTSAVLRACSDELAERLANDGRVWFVDVGRLDERAQMMGFVERAAATLLVSSGRPGGCCVTPITSRCRSGTGNRVPRSRRRRAMPIRARRTARVRRLRLRVGTGHDGRSPQRCRRCAERLAAVAAVARLASCTRTHGRPFRSPRRPRSA